MPPKARPSDDIPATAITPLDEIPDHPHLQAVGMFEEVDHPTAGRLRQMKPPVVFSDSPASVRRQAPKSVIRHRPDPLLAAQVVPESAVDRNFCRGG